MSRGIWSWAIGMVAIWPAVAVRAEPVNYQMVTVGDVGNAPDPATGGLYGAVAYEYRIGKYDVTIGQYTAFLNAVAKTDTYGLYNASMGTDLNIAGISRGGSLGSYAYSVMENGGSSANRPITYVSWFDAARFANWMHNGQGSGSTETGAYTLVGGQTSGTAPARNAGATFWIPTENEWYKAAYYQPISKGGPSDSYWYFATMSDTVPGNVMGGALNQANRVTGGKYSVTQSSSYLSSQNYLTDVDAFTGSVSYYGTFDQSGNVINWNDLTGSTGSTRGLRGGVWDSSYGNYNGSSFVRDATIPPDGEGFRVGFRLAGVPVPEIDPAGIGSVLALVGGTLGLLERRRIMAA